MKHILASLLLAGSALYLPCSLQAQTLQTLQTSLYFDSNQDELTAASQTELETFLKKLQQTPDFELDIRAYTDDKGSAEHNQALAERRAHNVLQYLATKNISTSKQEVLGVGEVEINKKDKKAVAEQRRLNRRVDVVVSVFQPKSLEDVFSYYSQRNERRFVCGTDRDTFLRGDKGTGVYIPAGAFQVKGGGEVKEPVVVELREAYTFGDMLMNNLSTEAGGQLLQTGGMVYLGATDANGKELELREDKEIQLSMPSQERLPKDMQLFVADRAGSDNGSGIDWQATNVQFTSYTSTDQCPTYNGTGINLLEIPKTIDSIQAFPSQRLKMPVKPSKPTVHQAKPQKPDLAKLQKQLVRRKGENNSEFELRIQETYNERLATYNDAISRNEKRLKQHEEAMAKYQVDLKKYEADLAAFKNYQLELENYMHDFLFKSGVSSLGDKVQNILQNLRNNEQIMQYALYLQSECNKFKFNDLAAKAQDIYSNLQAQTMTNKQLRKISATIQRINKTTGLHRCNSAAIQGMNLWPTSCSANVRHTIRHSWTAKFGGASDKQQTFEQFCEKFYDEVGQNFTSGTISATLEQINTLLKDEKVIERGQKITEATKELRDLYADVMAEKASKGFLSKDEQKNYATNLIGTARLGWINCDRFLSFPDNQLEVVTINHQLDADTKFYVIFEEMKSVIAFAPEAKKGTYVTNQYKGIPKTHQVKLIGLCIKGGAPQIFVQSCKVEDIKNLKIEFKHSTFAQLSELFKSLV